MILCLDLETSGLDEQHCGLLEIGAVWLHSGEAFTRTCLLRPDALIEPGALLINGYDPDDRARDRRALPESLALAEFLGWIRGPLGLPDREAVTLAGWNVHFDHRHLHAALTRAGIGSRLRPFRHRLLDCHSVLAAHLLRGILAQNSGTAAHSLLAAAGNEVPGADAAARLLNLPPEPRPHTALAGARRAQAILLRLLSSDPTPETQI